MEYSASIKVHDPRRAGVLVELSGEFDVSCLEAFGQALERVESLGGPVFVDLSGVTFMDALCVRSLAEAASDRDNPWRLCRPSEEFRLSLAACDAEEDVEVLPDNDPGYEALISEVCRCAVGRPPRHRKRRLYLREPVKGPERGTPERRVPEREACAR